MIPDSLASDMGDQRNVERARPRAWRQLAGEQRRVEDDVEVRPWASWLMILGLFSMIGAFWWVASAVLVTYWVVGRLFCAFAFAGNLFHGDWTHRVLRMSKPYWFMFNLLAIGPFLFCMFFALNGVFTKDPRRYVVPGEMQRGLKQHWIEHGELPAWILDSPGTRVVVESPRDTAGMVIRVLRVSHGLFGFDVMGWEEPDYIAP